MCIYGFYLIFHFQNVTEASLECVLVNSLLEVSRPQDSECCPSLRPSRTLTLLHQLAYTAHTHTPDHPNVHTPLEEILSLCVVLWGELGFYSPESGRLSFSFKKFDLLCVFVCNLFL